MVAFCFIRLLALFSCCFFLLVAGDGIPTVSLSDLSLADQICMNTTNCAFCKEAIFSDSRAPTADTYVLSYISFGLAYKNATSTRDYIALLLRNKKMIPRVPGLKNALRKCQGYYDEAIQSASEALDDLDSETFFFLGQYANETGAAVRHCESVTVPSLAAFTPLSQMNRNLWRLSEICLLVSKLYDVRV